MNSKMNNLSLIKKKLLDIQSQLKKRRMDDDFWVLADRTDFKPLIKVVTDDSNVEKSAVKTKNEINEHLLSLNPEKYKNSHFSVKKV